MSFKLKNISDFIAKLNDIKLEDIKNQFDKIKNTDKEVLKGFIIAHPNTIVISVCVIITAVFLIQTTGSYFRQTADLQAELSTLKDIHAVLQDFNLAKNDYLTFTEDFSKDIPNQKLLDKLLEIAEKHNIKIINFMPAENQKQDLWELSTVRLSFLSDSYTDILAFIKEIESPQYSMRIDGWNAELSIKKILKLRQENKEGPADIQVNITISAVKIK